MKETVHNSVMMRTHNTSLQAQHFPPGTAASSAILPIWSQCSGSHLVTLYPVFHAVGEVRLQGIWQTHFITGHVQQQIKALIQNVLLIKRQLVIHKLFVKGYFVVEQPNCSSATTAFCLFDTCCVFTA